MSKVIKCDRCGKFDDSCNNASLKRKDFNYQDAFKKYSYPDKIDLCGNCAEELLNFIKTWCKKDLPEELLKENRDE